MTDSNEKKAPTKQYQLLATGMMLKGVEFVRGDTVELDAEHGDRLETFGSVGPVGIIERMAKADAKAAELRAEAAKPVVYEARDEAAVQSAVVDAPRGPGRPRNGN